MRLIRLRKKEAAELRGQLIKLYPKAEGFVSRSEDVLVVSEEGLELLVFNGAPSFIKLSGSLIPTLLLIKLHINDLVPKVVVDEGAVKHLLNGADVMIPGIKEFDEFSINDVVSVWEPKKETPIVVGKALIPSNAIRELRKGKAIKNLHHAGDRIWNLSIKVYRELRSGDGI